MPWIELHRAFMWSPIRVQSIMYKPGVHLVTTPCANAAIKSGAAVKVDRPENASQSPKSFKTKRKVKEVTTSSD